MLAHGRECDHLADPLTDHLMGWFIDLNDGRRFTVVVGMSGGAQIPEAISHQEIAAWALLTGNAPTLWEVATLKEMDRAFRAAFGSKKTTAAASMQHQALGEYCHGESVEKCRRTFGTQLEKICATCPN